MKASADRLHQPYMGNQTRLMKASNHRFTLLRTVSITASVLAATVMASEKPEYTAAEARQHIGEKATVVGKVECISAGRTFHSLELDGGSPNSPFWIIVNDNASGPVLNVQDLKGVTVAVTGQLEKRDVYSHPWMVVKSTTQIQARTALKTDHISRAHEKESKGDLDGAMAEFGRAIEEQPDRRAEAYEFRGRIKERKGDWNAALADYDALVALDPKKADPYYIRATAKKQHGNFEGAMADFTRAAELRSSGISFVEIGNLRKANGDSTGAAAEYDKAIAMLDGQIAGVQKPSDRLDLLYYHRGYAKELKGDVDGAISDYSQAITIKPSYEAGAYSRRGDIKKARGDLAGAIADYEHAVQYAQLAEDKEKLEKAKAEAKTLAKSVATSPNIQATENETSFNKSEVTPESIAEAFVQAYSGMDLDALAGLYGDRVDHTNSGVISNAAVRTQAEQYFARWPVRQWSLVGPVKTISLGATKQKVIFSASYDVSDPQTNKHASGIAHETLTLASDKTGAIKIVSQKEQTSKRSSGQSDESREKTSENRSLKAAKVEYEASSHDEAARVRYVTKLAAMLGEGMEYWWRTHDRMGGPNLDGVQEELVKHPAPGSVDSTTLSRLLIGKWLSPRHVYEFRADGTYGMADTEQRDKWQIDGNKYIDDVSRGKIILIDDNYFVYTEGQGLVFYLRVKDPEVKANASDLAIKHKVVGYWKFPNAVCYIAADGNMYVGPRKKRLKRVAGMLRTATSTGTM